MIVCRGVSLKPNTPELIVIGLTPATLEVLQTEQIIELSQPAGLPFELHIVLAVNDEALIHFMRTNGARNIIVQNDGAPVVES